MKKTAIEKGIIAAICFIFITTILMLTIAIYGIESNGGLIKVLRSSAVSIGKEVKQISKEINENEDN